jgi:hypothetical protein
MSSQTIAFTMPFAVFSPYQFRPATPRGLTTATYTDDFNAVKALGRKTDSTRTPDQTELATFWEFNATIHWNDAANQIARANGTSLGQNVRLFALLNLAHADSAITTWSSKRYYGAQSTAVTWRPVHAIPLADIRRQPGHHRRSGLAALINTPSHPEYGAGHPSSERISCGCPHGELRRCTDIHAVRDRTSEPHLHEHLSGRVRW